MIDLGGVKSKPRDLGSDRGYRVANGKDCGKTWWPGGASPAPIGPRRGDSAIGSLRFPHQ